ncbi:1,4-alpha-glucan branching protein GlgB [Noviherbaspirillum sp. CPCC 100848]|uniref:1,4-alpha-glucan branching enzyme GlgB n=1 Tax=Noviherbaspirillum album TaxID=3080276 RepID=A0ABU6J1S2_9BURK|nr:1,4-alpha-glucan branching protein GlgB [Noviherbaspirillum sp. CPCC 100848]MEC4717562.1 1,4-alpha-glucan branching protein GlgB [Noviherbaspirillum sp. CPCC 100848]
MGKGARQQGHPPDEIQTARTSTASEHSSNTKRNGNAGSAHVAVSVRQLAGWIDPLAFDPQTIDAAQDGRLRDPFSIYGPHALAPGGVCVIRTFQPGAHKVEVLAEPARAEADGDYEERLLATLAPLSGAGLFSGIIDAFGDGDECQPQCYRLRITWPDGSGGTVRQVIEDPYAFAPLLSDSELQLLAQGLQWQVPDCLGALPMTIAGIDGTRFSVWAPNAMRVSVVGDFNQWDGRRHPMRLRHEAGVWELFVPRLGAGERYRYEILAADGSLLPQKADPAARATSLPPDTASVVAPPLEYRWNDLAWMRERAGRQSPGAPISIYEVHAASWRRPEDDPDSILDWNALAERLIPHVLECGFTHIELLPVMEHPFGGSWGYQPLSQFASSARFGSPQAFAHFVDRCHQAGLGVILDWVPAHFPTDGHGLACFDGSALYEHADPREGFHQDWNTLIYNLGRNEVAGMLIASALEWLERYHVDGLRVDAVSSLLYRDYSRKPGEWIPNQYGSRENLEAIAFLRRLNHVVGERCPGAMVIAEESTAWPGVSLPEEKGGLGFSYKWNMGWMHDCLQYMQREPVHRRYHHGDLGFGLCYAFSERFVLAISHDEVVHGKGSLLGKMPGDEWQQRANLRAFLGFMWTHPGKKLLFMGCEFGQRREWNHDGELQWELLDNPAHSGIRDLVGDLNRLYRCTPPLHDSDADARGFEWVVGDDAANSVFAYLRHSTGSESRPLLVVCNFTPVPRHAYRIGVPGGRSGARWREVLNTDAQRYGGSNAGNLGGVVAHDQSSHGQPYSVVLTLPPLATIVLQCEE